MNERKFRKSSKRIKNDLVTVFRESGYYAEITDAGDIVVDDQIVTTGENRNIDL